jgi:hypothetical protein
MYSLYLIFFSHQIKPPFESSLLPDVELLPVGRGRAHRDAVVAHDTTLEKRGKFKFS